MTQEKKINNVISIRSKKNGEDSKDKNGPLVISISSGKGGVGKTNIVANLGYTFCNMGKKVLIFDADLGLGNLDILLGLTPRYNLSHFLIGERNMDEILVDGPLGMKIIPAASGIKAMTHLSKEDKIPLLKKLDELIQGYDLFLIDTAAGISNNVLHFNAIAQNVLVVVSPEPTSLTDAYALIKVLSFHHGVSKFNLVVNMVKSNKEAEDVFSQLQMVTQKFLDVRLNYTGHILADDKIVKGVKRQKIVSELYPGSPSIQCFQNLAQNILKLKKEKRHSESSNLIWENILNA